MAFGTASNTEARIKVRKLDKNIIEKFIEKTSEITSGQDLNMSQDEIQTFLKRHLHKDSRFKSVIKFQIPGYPEQVSSMALDKNEFMDSIKAGSQKIEEYYNKVEILDVKISSDKRKATVKTQGTETGIMTISPDGIEQQRVPIEGNSTCNQIITINRKHIVQMYNANCTTTINFKEE